MSRKALGRGLGDLLQGARPARPVDRAAVDDTKASDGTSTGPETGSFKAPPDPAEPRPPSGAGSPTQVPHLTPGGPSTPSPTSGADRPPGPRRLPHFGPAYVPPPEPPPPGGRGGIYLVLFLDTLLLAFAAAMGFGPWVPRPLSLYLAGAAVLVGGTLACAVVAFQAAPHRPPTGSPKPSRVRVRLTRL